MSYLRGYYDKDEKEDLEENSSKPIFEAGIKNDRLDGKIMWELVPMDCIEEIAELYTKGAKKYAPNNWQKLENGKDRYYAALLRHLISWRKGENIDPDTKSRHLTAVAWNAIALMYLTKENNG